ncbi:MAG: HD-GYP domain-containing protein [Treponemataceae bacterium]|nr:HD-GYP domain-containing protein [Treponemataceae bacterium]
MSTDIDHARWRKVLIKTQLIAAIFVFLVELTVDMMIYLPASRGYTPEEIRQKFIRYLLIPQIINWGALCVEAVVLKFIPKESSHQKYFLLGVFSLICVNCAFNHYQFEATLMALLLPVLMTILYENRRFCIIVSLLAGVGVAVASYMRGLDERYVKNIIPETIIVYSLLIVFSIVSNIVISILVHERNQLLEAEKKAEKVKFVDTLNDKNRELTEEKQRLTTLTKQAIKALSNAVEMNDKYTKGHSMRVAEYSFMLGRKLDLSEAELEELYYAGLLHDVGKIGIDTKIINKDGKLTDEEFEVLRTHPMKGHLLLSEMSKSIQFKNLAVGARWHHERMDGRGYPDGLPGDKIPLFARIISVADSYDAMTSMRSYRSTMPQNLVRAEIEKGLGTQFDEKIGRLMIAMIDEDTNYTLRQLVV